MSCLAGEQTQMGFLWFILEVTRIIVEIVLGWISIKRLFQNTQKTLMRFGAVRGQKL